MKTMRFIAALAVASSSLLADTKPANDAHWSVQPVKVVTPPVLAGANHPIDRFILSQLKAKGLPSKLSAEADRRTLIRRLSFDLTGLPPTPERVQSFVNDADPQAYDHLVDELLASKHFGERWAQHWLDIAHYADTHGFERDKLRENAWRYRDYVIAAFNDDKPYDQFLREQIAGDVIAPNDEASVTATGFLAAGPWDFVGQAETKSDVLRRAARAGDLDDMVTQVMTSTMGLSINCARCHDHKLDPITQQEYYQLWTVFSGVKRGDREVNAAKSQQIAAAKKKLDAQLQSVRMERSRLSGSGLSLADIVGGGNGLGSGKKGKGIDPRSGVPQESTFGFLSNIDTNHLVRTKQPLVDSVVIPGGGDVEITSTGLMAKGVRKTSGQAWDAIRNGPVNSQHSPKLGDIDFTKDGHSLLGLHANAAITFNLEAIRKAAGGHRYRLTSSVGYFGAEGRTTADFAVYVDGIKVAGRDNIGRKDGLFPILVDIAETAKFLTLMATDGGDGLGNDQIGFGDARLELVDGKKADDEDAKRLAKLSEDERRIEAEIAKLGTLPKFYGVVPDKSEPVRLLKRGDPESPQDDELAPGLLHWIKPLSADIVASDSDEGARRLALAKWITDSHNPLTARVIVNRLWHHHFGQGIVTTPSDFGHGGDRPSHPELLDWLATELMQHGWSLKHVHRLMVTSAAYRQISTGTGGTAVDASNRLFWRQNPRRLDAESVRDAVLSVTGKLNPTMGGPGYRDFNYTEAYAPIYDYITPDAPELWRRSVYRFVVRTTPHQFMTTLDCPNPANFTPNRIVTTTALQALTLSNDDFMLKQAGYFADRVKRKAGTDVKLQVERVFMLAFGRIPTLGEAASASAFAQSEGLFALCRMILNANEFVYVD